MSKINLINAKEYDYTVTQLRKFFRDRRFIEVGVQHRLSILAACEDPRTIGTYNYAGQLWPLPQTGQMWLEYELLNWPDAAGYYCVSTSYRQEPNPVPGRHDLVFPMFEFETHGNMDDLIRLEMDLLEHLAFGSASNYAVREYSELAQRYGVKELGIKEEEALGKDYGPVCFATKFPLYTSPFWNMKKSGGYANKVDVMLYGVETIGSAERSTNPTEMRDLFHTISDGMYADILYSQFSKKRVEEELESFLALNMIPRCGGGIGITRMIRALKLAKKL